LRIRRTRTLRDATGLRQDTVTEEDAMGLETRATEKLDIEHPVIQAPMAGGVTTPELVAADIRGRGGA
jgi:hypothetical protein